MGPIELDDTEDEDACEECSESYDDCDCLILPIPDEWVDDDDLWPAQWEGGE